MPIKLRPHHFLCALCFQGKGYSIEFINNFFEILDKVQNGSDIEVVDGIDDVCKCCPNKHVEDCCDAIDKAYAKLLGIKMGDVFTWQEIKNLVAGKISITVFHKACNNCAWKKYSICEQALFTSNKK